MGKLIKLKTNSGIVHIAGIKEKYIRNIAIAAGKCDYIDKIILFGSCTKTECRTDSDIDMAVFGNQSRSKCLTSKKYEEFLKQVFSFEQFSQAYDILYFKTGTNNKSGIMNEIENGEVLYVRES